MCEKVESHDFFQEFFFLSSAAYFLAYAISISGAAVRSGRGECYSSCCWGTVLRSPMYTQKGSFFYFLGQKGYIKNFSWKKRDALKVLLLPSQKYQSPRRRSVKGSLSCLPPTGVKRKREKKSFLRILLERASLLGRILSFCAGPGRPRQKLGPPKGKKGSF